MTMDAGPMGVDDWIAAMAIAAGRLAALGAVEGAAGNMSVFLPLGTPGIDSLLHNRMPPAEDASIGVDLVLPDGVLLITGTGRRLPDLVRDPDSVLCAVVFEQEQPPRLHRARAGIRPTSEIDSHLGVHATSIAGTPRPHAVVHAQPPKLTWLSHIPAYQDEARMNRQLLRWQPETIVTLPEGIGVLPFLTPGTPAQGKSTARKMERHRLVVWSQHGVVARSDLGPEAAVDLIEYVETVAGYETLDIAAGRPARGLSLDQLRSIADRFGVSTALLDRLPESTI